MPRNFYVTIFIVLCIAVSIIGISFLNRISINYSFQLQKELNYPSQSLKYSLDKNKAYSEKKFGAQGMNENVSIAEKVTRTLQLPAASSLKTAQKFNKRNKRQAIPQKKTDFYSWKFNIDISPDSYYPVDDVEKSDSHLKSENLRLSFHVKNKTADEAVHAEADNAVISIKGLVSIRSDVYQSLLKKANEKESHQQILSSEKENSNKSESLPTGSVTLVPETNNLNSSSRGREGKFLFEFLGLRSKTRGETTTLSKTVVVPTDDSSLVARKNELLKEQNVKSNFGKESSQEIIITSESFRSAVTPTVHLRDMANVSDFDVRGTSEQDECPDCVSESLEPSTHIKEQKSKDIFQGTLNSKSSFTNEMLESFCMNLVNELEDKLQLSEEKSELDLEPHLENDSNQLKSFQNLSIPGVQNSSKSIKENDSSEDPAVLEESFLVSDESKLQNSRQSKFLDFSSFLGLGSGRSAFVDESDLISKGFDLNSIEYMPSIEDCETFFREKQVIKFTKPNLMDMISDPKIDRMDFANGTISPKLKEHQLQLLTNRLQDNLNITVETFDNLENTIETPESDRFSSLMQNETFLGEKVPQTISTLNGNDITQGTNTDSIIKVDEAFDTERDGRFIDALVSGSGRGEDIESSDNGRFFSLFASGERSLDTTDMEIARNERGSGDFFEDTIFSNNIRAINISEEGMFQEISPIFDKESKIFNLFQDGSGNGRELTKGKELSPSESIPFDYDCENDCNHGVTPNSSYDCSDCALEKKYIQETFPRNESECDDCNLEITYKSYDYSELQTRSTEAIKFKKDLAAPSHTPTESNEPIPRHQPEEVLDVIKRPTESYENECFHCNNDHDLVTENTIPEKENYQEHSTVKSAGLESSSKNESECNDCYTEIIYESYGYDELQKNKTEVIKFQKGFTTESNIPAELDEPFPNYQLEDKPNVSMSSTESSEIDETECFDCNEDNDFEVKILPDENFQAVSTVQTYSSIESVTITADNNLLNASTQNQRNEKVEKNPKHFVPVFLTGSGDGNFLDDNSGLITFIEETTVISRIPRKRGKALDDMDFSEIFENKHEDSVQIKSTAVKSSSFPATPRNPKRFGELPIDEGDAILNESLPSLVPSVAITERTKKLQTIFCTSARECNNALNERCVAVNASSICACSRGYVRHRETNKCVAMRVVETSMKFPAEKFDIDLENPFSSKFQQVKNSADETMLLLLKDGTEVFPLVAEVDAIRFKPGSLIVSWNIVLAIENESEMKLILNLEKDLQKAIKDMTFDHETTLNMRGASVLPIVSAIDPCQSIELNYCSKNAYCVSNEDFPGRFSCYCKEHYRDVSSNPLYAGETCIDICPAEYCGPYGHCEISENGNKLCLCDGMNFGRRCQIPGMIVLSILGTAACISIAVLLLVAFRKKCRTVRYGRSMIFQRSQDTNTHLQIDGRLSDEIALGENVGSQVTKFINISTPVPQIPVVKVTRPTFNGSSLSYCDFDSTFDVSPDHGNNPELKSTV